MSGIWNDSVFSELLRIAEEQHARGWGILVSHNPDNLPEGCKPLPTIHDIGGEYRRTVDHKGFGFFEGTTPAGKFTFDAGGALQPVKDADGRHVVGWSPLRPDSAEVLGLVGYDPESVVASLTRSA